MIKALSSRIWNNPNFHDERRLLHVAATKKYFNSKINQFDVDIIKRLLQSATSLALSCEIDHRHCAYEIAVNSWKIIEDILEIDSDFDARNVAAVVSLIFTRLGNFPADYYFTNSVFQGEFNLPFTLEIEKQVHKQENRIEISDSYEVYLTDIQYGIWETIDKYEHSAISAPTSAGKSFVFQNYIASLFLKNKVNTVLYVVPTRALIAQVAGELYDIIINKSLVEIDMVITEIPHPPVKEKTIYVLTQERAQILLECKTVDFDFVVVDEVQNINDTSRGIILHSVINDLIRRKCKKIVFGAPYANNVDLLFKTMNIHDSYSSNITNESAVLQNLIYIDVDSDFNRIVNIAIADSESKSQPIFSLEFNTELVVEDKILANIAAEYGKNSINIVYGSEPVKCEKIARTIRDVIAIEATDSFVIDPDLEDFSTFLKAEIHNDYLLADLVLYGVAYHYGRLPSFIRKGIESLFGKGKIKYLVCTSTLLQGVNLPAQNIFLLNPSKGQENRQPIPLDSGEFWNLAGRAGRLTKDFDGNIFLINTDSWITKISDKQRTVDIEPAFVKCVDQSFDELCRFVSSPPVASGEAHPSSLEPAFMKIYCDLKNNFLENVLPESSPELSAKKAELIGLIASSTKDIALPIDLVEKNKSISVLIQNNVYTYFLRRIREKGPAYLIPKHPLHPWETIIEGYKNFFYRINRKFLLRHTKEHEYYATIALIWMRGVSYSEMLRERIAYRANKLTRKIPDPNVEARGLFSEIENDLRFKYVKFAKCYNDILSHALQKTNNEEFLKTLSPIHLYLELGAASVTMISLISLGLSRTVAASLARLAPRTDMDSDALLRWIKRANLDETSHTVRSELSKIIRTA